MDGCSLDNTAPSMLSRSLGTLQSALVMLPATADPPPLCSSLDVSARVRLRCLRRQHRRRTRSCSRRAIQLRSSNTDTSLLYVGRTRRQRGGARTPDDPPATCAPERFEPKAPPAPGRTVS